MGVAVTLHVKCDFGVACDSEASGAESDLRAAGWSFWERDSSELSSAEAVWVKEAMCPGCTRPRVRDGVSQFFSRAAEFGAHVMRVHGWEGDASYASLRADDGGMTIESIDSTGNHALLSFDGVACERLRTMLGLPVGQEGA